MKNMQASFVCLFPSSVLPGIQKHVTSCLDWEKLVTCNIVFQ